MGQPTMGALTRCSLVRFWALSQQARSTMRRPVVLAGLVLALGIAGTPVASSQAASVHRCTPFVTRDVPQACVDYNNSTCYACVTTDYGDTVDGDVTFACRVMP